jgi:hypothetical protein
MRVVYGRRDDGPYQPGLFDGDEWQRAAQEWARGLGLVVRQWRVDQHIRVGRPGQDVSADGWFTITWTGSGWHVTEGG